MPRYFIVFSLVWEKLYPPHLRKQKHLEWGNVLVAPLQWIRNLLFDVYIDGNSYGRWDITTSYLIGERVYYSDRGLYEAITNNIGVTPQTATDWKLILENHIGVRERVKYNSQKLLFEFALNRWFDTIGLQIYITNNTIYTGTFIMDRGSFNSSVISRNSVNASSYLGNTPLYDNIAFTIFVPLAVFNALAATNIDRENIIRNFADKYVIAGMEYNVVTY
jgi:hypothetical protein